MTLAFNLILHVLLAGSLALFRYGIFKLASLLRTPSSEPCASPRYSLERSLFSVQLWLASIPTQP